MEKRRYSRKYALWHRVTGQFNEGDIVVTLRSRGIFYPRGAKFIVRAIEAEQKKVLCLRYRYPYLIPMRDLRVVGYVEGYKED